MKTNDPIEPLNEKEPKEAQEETRQDTTGSSEQEDIVPSEVPAKKRKAPSKPVESAKHEEPAAAEPAIPETEPAEAAVPAKEAAEPAQESSKAAKPATTKTELIDDHEEQKINESYDDDLDSDDNTEESEQINYNLLSKVDLVKLLGEKLDHPGKGNIRKEVEEIKQAFFEKQKAALEDKKKHFLDEGGNLEDFKPAEDPVETELKELLNKYRGLKAEFTRQLERTKQDNMLKKQEILEELRILMEGQESFEITFRKFKDLQRQWFSAGIVPQQNLKDLWDSYNYFVEKFNDYVRINRELRALDLKKNLELKIQLCERTEELDKEPNIVQAFKTLQKFHTRWREIGPVPRDDRDEVWDRFKQATSVINRKHQDYHSKLKESLFENLEKKSTLCERVERIAQTRYETHGAWMEKTNQVLEIQKTWKTIGYAPKKDNSIIYARFRKACDTFFGNKAAYYASAYEEQKDNLSTKTEIVEKAESLSKSQDWKETSLELIRLQKRWKEVGPVPRRDSDKLWKRFRTACDHFFNQKSKYFEDIDSSFDDNLKAKEDLVAEMDAFVPGEDRQANMKALEMFQEKFDSIGFVPSAKKDLIKDEFRLAQDRLLEKIGMNESERSIFRFKNRISSMMLAPRSEMKLNFERDKLINKLQQLRNDIGVWENNIGFFKQSDSAEETIQGFHEKIESAHERIRVLELKIRLLDDMENAN